MRPWRWLRKVWGSLVGGRDRQLQREREWLADNRARYERARAARMSVEELRKIVEAAKSAHSLLECFTNDTTPQHGGVIVGEARARLEAALDDWTFAFGYEVREQSFKSMLDGPGFPDLGLGTTPGD